MVWKEIFLIFAVYGEDGTEIGRAYGSNKHTWVAGSTNFVNINPNKGMDGVQATYVSVGTGGNDAICISAVSVAWPDGSTPKVCALMQSLLDALIPIPTSLFWIRRD